jgi:AraC-like DNA-binding protein
LCIKIKALNLELHIRDMVCVCCKMAVATVLNNLKIAYKSIELGKVLLEKEMSVGELDLVENGLAGFELYVIKDRKEIIAREDFTITAIANLLGFSSVSHLCIQFKKITGKDAL